MYLYASSEPMLLMAKMIGKLLMVATRMMLLVTNDKFGTTYAFASIDHVVEFGI